jgi:hypothetical protein
MQLRRDEAGLLSHNGELLLKSIQEIIDVLRRYQKGAEQDHWRDVVFDLFRKADVWVHLDEFRPGTLGECRLERQDRRQCCTD